MMKTAESPPRLIMTSADVRDLINEVWQGVEASKVGPILTDENARQYDAIALHTFLCILGKVCPNGDSTVNHSGGYEVKQLPH